MFEIRLFSTKKTHYGSHVEWRESDTPAWVKEFTEENKDKAGDFFEDTVKILPMVWRNDYATTNNRTLLRRSGLAVYLCKVCEDEETILDYAEFRPEEGLDY